MRQRFGRQPPRHRFFLNPYTDSRFTVCPQCGRKTRSRKLPLVIHIDPRQLIALNKTCRYCAHCDLLIAHRDQLESTLAASLSRVAVGSQEYLVLGTMDRAAWRRGTRTPPAVGDALEHVHDFAQALRFEPLPRWSKA